MYTHRHELHAIIMVVQKEITEVGSNLCKDN